MRIPFISKPRRLWQEAAVRRLVEQAIKETREHTLQEAADWHHCEAVKEENIYNNTSGKCGDLRIEYTHRKSEEHMLKAMRGEEELHVSMIDQWRRSRGGGFTLIELMIVVCIIGILAAIAIPKFAQLLDASKCHDGDVEACDRVKARRTKYDVPVADAKPAPVTPGKCADESQWKRVLGEIVSVEHRRANLDHPLAPYSSLDIWFVVLKMDDGTQVNAMLPKPAVQGLKACVAISPDQGQCTDDIIPCQ